MVVDRGETVFLDSMDASAVTGLIDAGRKVKGGHVVVCGSKAAYVESTAPVFLNNVQPYYARFEIVPDLQAAAQGDAICKVAVFSEGPAETDAYPVLRPLEGKDVYKRQKRRLAAAQASRFFGFSRPFHSSDSPSDFFVISK